MAITKLNYIGTPKGGGAAHLKNAIVYIMNPNKTENDVWVGGNAGDTPGVETVCLLSRKGQTANQFNISK